MFNFNWWFHFLKLLIKREKRERKKKKKEKGKIHTYLLLLNPMKINEIRITRMCANTQNKSDPCELKNQ